MENKIENEKLLLLSLYLQMCEVCEDNKIVGSELYRGTTLQNYYINMQFVCKSL